jgi:DNA modification methylase
MRGMVKAGKITAVTNELIFGDAIEILKDVETESIGAVICDPPYFISSEAQINRGSQGVKYKGQDLTLEFGEWDHFESVEDYWNFSNCWMKLCVPLIKPGGFFITFFDKRRISWPFDILEDEGFKTKEVFTWVKSNPVPQVRKVKFAQATEMAAILCKPGPNRFQWQNGYHPNYKKVPIVGGHQRLKDAEGNTLHPTQKPIDIVRLFVDYYSEPGDVICDPFMGTGTTIVASIMAGRQYLGIENNETYFTAAVERIAKVQPDLIPIDYKDKSYKRKFLL